MLGETVSGSSYHSTYSRVFCVIIISVFVGPRFLVALFVRFYGDSRVFFKRRQLFVCVLLLLLSELPMVHRLRITSVKPSREGFEVASPNVH